MPAEGFTCPCCGRTSHNPEDWREGYCGSCRWPTGNPDLLKHRPDLEELRELRIRCLICEEAFAGGDKVGGGTILVTGPNKLLALRFCHIECLALGIAGHDHGVCSCTGYDTTSRTAAIELWKRLQAANTGTPDAGAPEWKAP